VIDRLRNLGWPTAILLALTLGLAPFAPKPHFIEKIQMLFSGTLRRPIDIFDLFMHGAPWALLALKAFASLRDKD
jgi:hypothetical protein